MTSPARIRPFRQQDLPALYDIALRTGAGGEDATGRVRDEALIGDLFVGPYALLEPELVLVAEGEDNEVVGYVAATDDSSAFEARCEGLWWPRLRERLVDPPPCQRASWGLDEHGAHLAHHPVAAGDVAIRYPANLHMNLLPGARGQGLGAHLFADVCDLLQARGAPGVHVRVGPDNVRAIAFYRALGFVLGDGRSAASVTLVRSLEENPSPTPRRLET